MSDRALDALCKPTAYIGTGTGIGTFARSIPYVVVPVPGTGVSFPTKPRGRGGSPGPVKRLVMMVLCDWPH
jgi:hypothetical protein